MRVRRIASVPLLLLGLAACAPAAQGADEDGPWMYDAADAPPGARLESTELHDPEFEDYLDNPIHHFAATGVDAPFVLSWYRETLTDDGWRALGADGHQLIMRQVRAERVHLLIVETYTPRDELFDSYSVEEYRAEV